MPFEKVTLLLADGQRHGPVDWPTVQQWAREGRVGPAMTLIDEHTGEQRPAASFGDLAAVLTAPADNGAGSTIIPYKNPPALISYYLGLFSLSACIPLLGFVGVGMAIAALILGLKGLKRVRANPECKGTAHAWIGVICGGLCTLLGLPINVIATIALVSELMK